MFMILKHLGIDFERFSYKWVSAAEGIRFVQLITAFDNRISDIGRFGEKEDFDPQAARFKMKAAIKTLEGRTFRMAFARQAKQIKETGTFGQFPSKEKLLEVFIREMNMYQVLACLKEKNRTAEELTGLLGIPEEQVVGFVETLKKKNMWEGELKIKP